MESARNLILISCRTFSFHKRLIFRCIATRKDSKLSESIRRSLDGKRRAGAADVQAIIEEEALRRKGMLTIYGRKLNTRFAEAINDEFASGSFSENFQSLNFTDIRLSSCYNKLEVFWQGSGNQTNDNQTQKELKAVVPKLRSLLFQRRLVQRMPEIIFVKDLRPAFVIQVEGLLESVIEKSETTENVDEAAEEKLRYLYPYHDQLRIEQAAKRERLEKRKKSANEPLVREEELKPPGTEFYDSAAGLPYNELCAKVLRAMQKSAKKRDGYVIDVEEVDFGEDTVSQARERAVRAREEARKEFRAVRERRRRENKSSHFWEEEEENDDEFS